MATLPTWECVDIYNPETGCMEATYRRVEPRPKRARRAPGNAAPAALMARFNVETPR